MLGHDYHFDMVRPGYALYGGQTSPERTCPVSPVVAAYARVLQVRDVAPGQTVGYAASYEPARISRIAVIAGGYADGLPRHMSSTRGMRAGHAAFAGHLVPFAGRVSMDLITLDVTEIDDPPVQRGNWAELIGPHISLEDVGNAAGTIGYEILTRLGLRFHLVYLEPGT
jgi:alanine racemase